jgi:hypothetical protein
MQKTGAEVVFHARCPSLLLIWSVGRAKILQTRPLRSSSMEMRKIHTILSALPGAFLFKNHETVI